MVYMRSVFSLMRLMDVVRSLVHVAGMRAMVYMIHLLMLIFSGMMIHMS
jgi:hypothetical protein